MSDYPIAAPAWQHGLTLEQYVDGMSRHQAATRRRLAQVRLTAADRAALGRVAGARHALVMTEDWCGDSLLNVPILAAIVAAVPGMDMRVFSRAAEPALEAYYQARGITHIPVFSFLDDDFKELATWVERPQAAHERLAAWYAARPEVAALRADTRLDPEERRSRLRPLTAGLLDEMEGWYNAGLQQATIDEIRQLLGVLPLAA
jgi:hypothetical protein